MKIVIDFRIFGTKPGGLGRYNQEFLNNLKKLDQENHYILIFTEDPNISLPANFEIKICDCHWYGLKEQLVLPWLLYKLKPDLVHFTHFNVPIFYYGNFVVTIHDLIMTKFPTQKSSTLSPILFKIKYWFYQQVIRNAIKNSKKIIAVSKFTAKDIKEYFELTDDEAKKINVIYEGVSKYNSSQKTPFQLPQNYFLYVGNAYPHKNLEFLMHTFNEFWQKHPEYYLILVGQKNYFYQRLAKNIKYSNVIFAGYIADDKLPNYYKNAKAYIFPSLYEGFGLPPLEAMSYGLPVLSSNTTSLPEILGHSVLYFDPQDKDDLKNKMFEIVNNTDLRNTLIRAGYKQIEKYSWHQMTKAILEIYKILV
ncbi:MAG: glycosyltransferase family 1 protein [Patescibacteria group bacterium]|jgi:glycosyltransferase involved in cell wall biosynthesis